MPLSKTNDFVYSCPVYFGTPKQYVETSRFIPDTMIDYLVATTVECANCSSQYYNMTHSSTDKFNSETSIYELDGLTLEGRMGTDHVCVGDFD